MKSLTISFCIAIVAIVSCQQPAKEAQSASTSEKKDSAVTVSQVVPKVDSGYADVNGIKLYYEVYGSGKPIVLLHGAFMNIPLNWANVIPMLGKDRKVIVAEMQGHGRTKDTPRDINYDNMADDVSGLLKHLKVDSADVMGYSMGGSIAFRLAIRHPEQVRRLVVLSGTYASNGWYPDVLKIFGTFSGESFKGSPIAQSYASNGNDTTKFDAFIKKVMKPAVKGYDWTNEVNNLKMPILMAIGDMDGVQYEHALKLFRAHGGGKMGDFGGLPKSRLAIIPGTTHIGMMMHINWVVPMVTDFLDADLNAPPPTF